MRETDKITNLTLFQKRVTDLMRQKGYKISDLANYANISIESAKRYTEDISSEPTIKIARSIAQALDTDLDYLLGLWDGEPLLPRPQKADELLINLFKSVTIFHPAIEWYADANLKMAVICPNHEKICSFFKRFNSDCDEIEVRSIVSKFVLEIEEEIKNPNESKAIAKKRVVDDVEELSELPGFGDRLNQFIANENFTPRQLSERTGIPYETVSSYFKKNSASPRINNAVKFAKAFGVGLDFLLGISDDRYSINPFSAATGALVNLHKMLQYANFKMQINPDSGDIVATSNNRFMYYFFRRIHSVNTMEDMDLVIKEAENFCHDYKLRVLESGEIVLYDEYVDSRDSEILDQFRRVNAIRAILEHKEEGEYK